MKFQYQSAAGHLYTLAFRETEVAWGDITVAERVVFISAIFSTFFQHPDITLMML